MIRKIQYAFYIAAFFILLARCANDGNVADTTAPSSASTQDMIAAMMDSGNTNNTALFAYPAVNSFYKMLLHKPVWSKNGILLPHGDSLIDILERAAYLGLYAGDYHINEIVTCNYPENDPVSAAQLDILLTDAFIGMAHHLRYGRLDSKDLSYRRHSSEVDSTVIYKLFLSIMDNDIRNGLEYFEPKHGDYQLLKRVLHERLDLQQRQGFDVAIQESLTKILTNMERWRWESPFPARHIFVNIPAFELQVVENDSVTLRSRVIVGTPEKPTPLLNGIINHFIIYPYWNVPRSITVNELLPQIKRDTGYLRRHLYDVLDRNGQVINPGNIDWTSYQSENFPFSLRQREGEDNTLGIIKFVFSNPYSVYLHDTNAPRLFRKEMRALSHGCIRVEKAVEMAYHLVREDSLYNSPDDLEQYFQWREREVINLVKPIPLRIRYFTCAWREGALEIYPDVYERDDVIVNALNSLPPAKEVATTNNKTKQPAITPIASSGAP